MSPGKFEVVAPYMALSGVDVGDEVSIYRNGVLSFKGVVEKKTYLHSVDGERLSVQGFDLKYKLLQKIFHDPNDPTKYYHGYVDVEPSDVVRDIAAQAGLGVDGVEDTGLTVTLRFYYENLLQALRHVAEVVGWEFTVLPDGNVVFKESLGSSYTVDYRDYLSSIEHTVDYSDIANKIIVLGRGVPDDEKQLTLMAVVEDAESQSKYGVRERLFIDRRFVHQDTLEAYAQRLLDDYKNPKVTLKLDFLPIADFNVGDKVSVINHPKIDPSIQFRVLEKRVSVSADNISVSLRLGNLIHQTAVDRYERISSVLDEIKKIQSATIYAQGDKVMLNESLGQNSTPNYPVRLRFTLPDTTLAVKDLVIRVWANYIRHYTLTDVKVEASDIKVKSFWGYDTDDLWRRAIIQHTHRSTSSYAGDIGEDTSSVATSVDISVRAPDDSTTTYTGISLPAEVNIENSVTIPGVYSVEVTPNDKSFLEIHLSGIIFLDVRVA